MRAPWYGAPGRHGPARPGPSVPLALAVVLLTAVPLASTVGPDPAAPEPVGSTAAGDHLPGTARVVTSEPLADRGAPAALRRGPASPDDLAGVVARVVPPAGTGALAVVPGSMPAPGPGPAWTVRVEVEGGLPVDATVFAAFVLQTLNDPRGWGRGGGVSFARTDGAATTVVVLASPETSARLCHPLVTLGTLSCRNGQRAVITHYRWVEGHPDYGGDLSGYRRYVVNHEVGHALGHGHEQCPGPGAPAPVMQQQTLGLVGCAPNSWPHP